MIAHWLPCKIDADGVEANVQSFFDTSQRSTSPNGFNGNPVISSSLRGRPIKGIKLQLPDGYEHVIANSSGQMIEDEPGSISIGTKIDEVFLWNLSTEPSASDKIPSALLWLQLADVLHSRDD
ncbi:unnamed protein product [Calicophoron daubneyi]|uniref:Uncharacterized protein n=1 Tax=Calicophoron daubneyi TaxID=300641 RepID=A0AAV2U0I4_CALDB